MIRVEPAPEPEDFDRRVRQRGLSALAEMVGEEPPLPHLGRRRKKLAEHRDEIPPAKFPDFWREVLPDLLEGYRRLCAYSSLYIERVTGGPSVDHMAPKSRRWDQVYEWSNYRLACALMNARKRDFEDVLDPFEIGDGWFELELVEFQVKARGDISQEIAARVEATIDRLNLNAEDCRKARQEYVEAYLDGAIDYQYLERRCPFIAQELRRQGRLLPADT